MTLQKLFKMLFFNWRKSALQHCVGFCHTTTQFSQEIFNLRISQTFWSFSHLQPLPFILYFHVGESQAKNSFVNESRFNRGLINFYIILHVFVSFQN